MNYIWLLYLPLNMISYWPIKNFHDCFWLLVIALFLLDYILVYENNDWRIITIPIELLITASFAIYELNFYMIIFSGWQISYILGSYPKKYFNVFCMSYYFILCIGVVCSIGHLREPVLSSYLLFFVVCSPLISISISRAVLKRQQLHQENRRLEAIVRKGERDRIARDLHDTLGQSFSIITIKAELAKKLLVKRPDQVSDELSDIEDASRQNLQLIRNIVNDLHQKSLTEVLLEQGKNLSAADLILITKGEMEASEWPTLIQNQFAEVLPEAITNVIRHAHAHEVQMTFVEKKDFYQIIVRDDGRAKNFERKGSNGISGMRTRMKKAHGTFDITHDRQGTKVEFVIYKEKT